MQLFLVDNSRNEAPRSAAVEGLQQHVHVSEASGPRRKTQTLVLGKHVDEPVADVIAVLVQQLPARLAVLQHLPDRRVETEPGVTHQKTSWALRLPGGHARAPVRMAVRHSRT